MDLATTASPEAVLRAIGALNRYHEPPDPVHPAAPRKMLVLVNGAGFSLRLMPRTPWLREYRPALHGSVASGDGGGAVVRASCGYNHSVPWSAGIVLAGGVPVALSNGWMGIIVGAAVLLAVLMLWGERRVRARNPDESMLLQVRALEHAVRSAEHHDAGTASASVRPLADHRQR